MMTSSLNLSYADNSSQTTPNTPPIRNYMSCILTKWAFEYHGKIPLNILFRYFSDMDSACNPSTAVSSWEESDSNTIVEENSRYPGCDTDDIILDNGQVWSACNVGVSKAGTGIASYGPFFQWWRNTADFTPAIQYPYDWQARNDRSWWVTAMAGIDFSNGTYVSDADNDLLLMRWPCESGYHVPTLPEWEIAQSAFFGSGNQNPENGAYTLQNILYLPLVWMKTTAFWTVTGTWISGVYWTSNSFSYQLVDISLWYLSYSFKISNWINARNLISRAVWASVRCIKD